LAIRRSGKIKSFTKAVGRWGENSVSVPAVRRASC
jgi:hypothetical protein